MLFLYTVIYFISVMLYYIKHNYIASVIMISLAIFLYAYEVKKSKRLINVRGLFALGFIGGFGLSLLKLSKLSSEYNYITFIAVFISYFTLYIGVYLAEEKNKKEFKSVSDKYIVKISGEKLIIILIAVTFLAFLIEVAKLKFIPLFTIDTPHAYSTFHVFMLHYITSFNSFIPCFAICNYYESADKEKNKKYVIIAFIYVIVMALLLVSRSRLITSMFLSAFIVLMYETKNAIHLNKKNILVAIGVLIGFLVLYMIITKYRAHSVEYLKDIFEMKDEKMPIFISQPYMYIAHNFENLNYMINNIFRWTCGRRMLYPLFTLTFIKKFFPIVVDSPYYIIKEELSTVTLIYDFYYDFGLLGVAIFCFIIGYAGKYLEDRAYGIIEEKRMSNNNYLVVLFALYSYYMLFSFFQTYFSLTDTWVYIIIILLLSKFILIERKS